MALSSNVLNLLFGRPLATSEERAEHIGPVAGIPFASLTSAGTSTTFVCVLTVGAGSGPHAPPAKHVTTKTPATTLITIPNSYTLYPWPDTQHPCPLLPVPFSLLPVLSHL